MSLELPALSAVVARLPYPEINLAAYGGVVFPLALIIESPIIMFLAASTALSKDWVSFSRLRRYMHAMSAALTALHILVAFTPLFDFIVKGVLGAPAEIIEPARTGFQILTPWTWSIAYRRFHQGVLIRFNRSNTVGIGTIIRLSSNIVILLIGFRIGTLEGIVVATSAVATGVVAEAIYAGLAVQPVLQGPLKLAPAVNPAITRRSFLAFYLPLILTSLLTLLVNPLGSAALSRMPLAIESLAVWPVMSGLIFMFRSLGIAFNEVVVALLDEAGSWKVLRRFALLLASINTTALLFVVATPLAGIWFGTVSGLPENLVGMALQALWITLPLPALSVLQSWYQGSLLHGRQTRVITESVAIFLVVCSALLASGVVWGKLPGLEVGWGAFSLATLIQTAWLWLRSRSIMRQLAQRDTRDRLSDELKAGTPGMV